METFTFYRGHTDIDRMIDNKILQCHTVMNIDWLFNPPALTINVPNDYVENLFIIHKMYIVDLYSIHKPTTEIHISYKGLETDQEFDDILEQHPEALSFYYENDLIKLEVPLEPID